MNIQSILAICTPTICNFKTSHFLFIITFQYFDNNSCFSNVCDLYSDHHPFQEAAKAGEECCRLFPDWRWTVHFDRWSVAVHFSGAGARASWLWYFQSQSLQHFLEFGPGLGWCYPLRPHECTLDPAVQDHEIQPFVHAFYVITNVTHSLDINHALGIGLVLI